MSNERAEKLKAKVPASPAAVITRPAPPVPKVPVLAPKSPAGPPQVLAGLPKAPSGSPVVPPAPQMATDEKSLPAISDASKDTQTSDSQKVTAQKVIFCAEASDAAAVDASAELKKIHGEAPDCCARFCG